MQKYRVKAAIAIILSMLMAFLFPVQVFAQNLPAPEVPENVTISSMGEEVTANIVAEIEEKRDETTKHFRMDDGTIMAVSYGTPVHYKNAKGKWVEYDNSLITDESSLSEATADEAVCGFMNKKSDISVKIAPHSQKNKMVKIGGNKGNISWKYIGAKLSNARVKNNSKKHKGNEKFTNIDNLTATAQYDNIYDNVDLECIVSPSGVKENIILENANAQNEFEMVYNIKGLTAQQVNERTIRLTNENKKEVYTISAPYMYDAEGNTSEDLSLEILKNNGNKLTVKLVADEGFINALGRQFPLTIDPEVTVIDESDIKTAQICENTPNYVENQSTHFYLGVSSTSKTYSALIKSDGIEDDFTNKNIVSAKVKIYSIGPSSPMEIDAYPVTSAWTQNTVTYNGITYNEDIIDYAVTKAYGTTPAVFDITKTFKQWCSGEMDNNGILFKSDDYYTDFAGYAYYYDSSVPRFEIIYKEYNGSESHLTSHSMSCGHNGQLSVVHYTGDVVYKQELYSEPGSRFPMELYATKKYMVN